VEPGPAGGLSLVDVRRLWPDIVEATKRRRRVTWIHLTQNAQVVAVDAKTLTLGFSNAGARESFDNGGSAEIVRQAAIDVVGADWRIETIVDPGAQVGPVRDVVTRPAVQPAEPPAAAPEGGPAPRREESPGEAAPEPPADPGAPPPWAADDPGAGSEAGPGAAAEPARRSDPGAIAAAREAIQQTRQAGGAGPERRGEDLAAADAEARPDDLDAETQGLAGAELLRRELGAQVIDEIRHT
jgi:DNA polymerase-3 subunit gamma/tau